MIWCYGIKAIAQAFFFFFGGGGGCGGRKIGWGRSYVVGFQESSIA